jgi:hypothetical protein
MTSKKITYAEIVAGWRDLTSGLTANGTDLTHLNTHRQLLLTLMEQSTELTAQQAVHTAAKQEVTRQLQDLLDQGQKLATYLRTGVKQHYGNRSEKLVEFGLQPFRGRRLPVSPPTPPVEVTSSGEK